MRRTKTSRDTSIMEEIQGYEEVKEEERNRTEVRQKQQKCTLSQPWKLLLKHAVSHHLPVPKAPH